MRGWMMVAAIAAGTVLLLVLGTRALLRGRRVPPKAKLAIAGAIIWLLSPVDLLPDLLPVGLLDDVAVLVAAVRYVLQQVDSAPVEERVLQRRAIDVTDWRLPEDPADSR